jgi:hypothetical protein
LEEFRLVKEGYSSEIQARKDLDIQMVRLKSELRFYQQANIFHGHDFIHYSKEEVHELNQARADLEQFCYELRSDRDALVAELERVTKSITKTHTDMHWERLQHAYQQQLDSMKKDIQHTKTGYARLIKGREEIISDMILLNTKNAELTQLNNDLSRRVMEREQEAKAVFAGTSFLSSPPETVGHKRNLSTGSLPPTDPATKLAQRDSFGSPAAPKLFKFGRNRSGSKTKPGDLLEGRKHHFIQAKFIMAVKCEGCNEKMRRVNELKCSGNKKKKKKQSKR